MEYSKEWEYFEKGTRRMKVFGGWIFNTYSWDSNDGEVKSEALCFVPDPKHEWVIK